MDEFDAFYQQLDSERLLTEHGPGLVADAREILAKAPEAKLAGTILMADSKEAEVMRQMLVAASGQALPTGLMVGVCARETIEPALVQHVGTELWQEPAGLPQCVLPVLVATRDGVRFGFFRLDRDE
ncbi:MAG: hypothetical protein IPM29_19985 [Planctomycetes bacterium]|nr:hypothetical protein [Planctomycetota bacterium]